MGKIILKNPVLIIILFSLIIPVTHLRGDIDPDSKKGQTKFAKPTQEATLDWKVHNVGKIRQVVTNTGGINAVPEFNTEQGLHDYPGLLNCEFPPGSSVEHLFEAGIKVGSIQDGDTLVTVSNWNNQHINFEFFPTNSPNDTVWVVNKGDSVDIPYWPGYYKAIGDQDFVCKYSDYNVTNISIHTPLYIDVIQTSHAWSSFPVDNFIVYDYYVIPTRNDLTDAYFAYMLQGRVGNITSGGLATDDDDVASYSSEHNMGIIEDLPGGPDGTITSPVGIKILPPEDVAGQLNWTFNWYAHHHETPFRDKPAYAEQMASHNIQSDQIDGGQSIFAVSFGPFDLAVGDTLHFRAVQILGEDIEQVLNTADLVDLLVERDFQLPSPPPVPPLEVAVRSTEVTLDWTPSSNNNPEQYTDPFRADNAEQPFEGYRIYKSQESINGPWTLLAEYDIADNDIGFNTGLRHEIEDVGLLDYFEYFYTVTAFSKPDTVFPVAGGWPSQESALTSNAIQVVPGPDPQPEVGEVAAVPNPYRGDVSYNTFTPKWEKNPPGRPWVEQDRRILFINLPVRCEIRIYTLAGDLVQTLQHNDPVQGYEEWNLTSDVGQAIASGIYLFTVENDETGEVQTGKFVVIK